MALERMLQQQALEVQNMELKFYYDNYETVSTISAVMAGFSFDALKTMAEDEKVWYVKPGERVWQWVLFASFATLSLSLMLMTVLVSTLCQIWGPGKALRGAEEDAFAKATAKMRGERGNALKPFGAGIVCFTCSVFVYATLANVPTEAFAVGAVLLVCAFLGIVSALRIHRRFKIPEKYKKTGAFNVRESLYSTEGQEALSLLRQRHAAGSLNAEA
eukprot:g3501.t1